MSPILADNPVPRINADRTTQALYPVILCGGGGTRLWPTSRPSRPKQFLSMAGKRSLFQDAVLRMVPLAEDGGRVLVIGGLAHRRWIIDQLSELGVEAQVLLEPEARDSAPAMAAAAAWVARADPTGVIAFVASDHHIPDHDAFRAAVAKAGAAAAKGRIVTLGVKPDGPSSAYGYIRPSGTDLSGVAAFVEKPDAADAAAYIAAGYLWNSGNFMVRAQTLLDELSALAPGVLAAAKAALPGADGGPVQLLGAAFSGSPRISIDYAVMEKTRLADVLAVDFGWSDMGAWDAIAASGEGDASLHIFEDSEGCLVRAPDGVLVAALGVSNIAIVVEPDAVLVTALNRAQDVKRVVERVKALSPHHLDFASAPPESLAEGAHRLADWLRLRALPLWGTMGLEDGPGFTEAMGLDGRSLPLPVRARIQPRQIYVYATAGRLGWSGPWRRIVSCGLEAMLSRYLRDDGSSMALVARNGAPLDQTSCRYDQAFALFALAHAKAAGVKDASIDARALGLRGNLSQSALPQGGFIEAGVHPYQSNSHMHLLEACMAWEGQADADWAALSDGIVDLAERRFIDPANRRLRAFYDADWNPAMGEAGRLVEPGHQFKWAWLLARHGLARRRPGLIKRARGLYARGREGVSERGGVAQDALNDNGSLRSGGARLWPQTEWLKAALLLANHSRDTERAALMADAETALQALWLYLTPDGLWRDKRLPDGGFVDESAPASSFYHIMGAFDQLAALGGQPGFKGLSGLDLR